MNNSSVKLSTDDWELSAKEIADIIWLALHMEPSKIESSITNTIINNDNITDIETNVEPLPNKPSINDNQELEINIIPPKEKEKLTTTSEGKAGLYPQNQGENNSGLSLKVPDAVSIPEPLNLARKLKPLMRQIASSQQIVLDEEKTAEAIANNQGIWFPVLKPSLDLWLDLELVVDQSVSMLIWRQTIKELERLLKNYGVFRDVRIWGLTTNEKGEVQIHRGNGISLQSQVTRSYKELVNSSGRSLILVVSDCVSPFWHSEKMTSILEHWTKHCFMAIIQMLPQWMWERTSLGWASEVQLKSLNLGTLNHNLITKAISTWDDLEEGAKVPIFTLEADMVEKWVQMLIGKSNIWNSGYLFPKDIDDFDHNELFQTGNNFTAVNRVQIFRATASPVGRKLASLLAAAPVITLPIVRLIQRSLLKESLQVNVAEVFLGGLLKPLSEIKPKTNPDTVQYDFMDDVRDLLLDHLPDSYVLDVVNEVSEYIAKKIGLSLDDFIAVLKQEKIYNTDTDNNLKYFATVTAQILRRLGGEYEKFAQTLNDSWENTLKDNQENDNKTFLYQHGNTKIYSFLTEGSYSKIKEVDTYKKLLKLLTREILSSFSRQQLQTMMRFEVDETLNQIDFSDTYQNLVFNLIKWAESGSKLDDLIRMCYYANPSNGIIKRIYESLPLGNKHTINFQIKTEPYGTYEINWEVKKKDFEAYTIGFRITEGLRSYSLNSQVIDIDEVELLINVEEAIKKTINFIQKENKNKLFLPLLGVGASNLPIKDVAITILSSIIKSLNNLSSHSLKEIILVDNNEDNIKIINDFIPNFIFLENFKFTTVTVDRKGKIINEETKSGKQFTEILPGNVKLHMVLIPTGEFMMGAKAGEIGASNDEYPQHKVIISQSFFMGKYPITQEQYESIMNDNPSHFKGKNLPVERVTWKEAVEFCEKLSILTRKKYSLPSEAQWEYAARAKTTTPFYFGETITSDLANYNGNYTYAEEPRGEYGETTTDVGIFPPNAFGLYDIHGNVWEWCQDDWHNNYKDAPIDGKAWINTDSEGKIRRGGSWNSYPNNCRVASRNDDYRLNIYRKFGFRVICDWS